MNQKFLIKNFCKVREKSSRHGNFFIISLSANQKSLSRPYIVENQIFQNLKFQNTQSFSSQIMAEHKK